MQVPSPGAVNSAAGVWHPWAALPSIPFLPLHGKTSPRGSAGEVGACRQWIWLLCFHVSCDLVILSQALYPPLDQTVAWQQNKTVEHVMSFKCWFSSSRHIHQGKKKKKLALNKASKQVRGRGLLYEDIIHGEILHNDRIRLHSGYLRVFHRRNAFLIQGFWQCSLFLACSAMSGIHT